MGTSAELHPQSVNTRRRKGQFTYEADSETIRDPKQTFTVSLHFAVLYTTTQPVEQRLTQRPYVVSSMLHFLDKSQYVQKHHRQIMEDC